MSDERDRPQADRAEHRTRQRESGSPNPIQQHLFSGRVEGGPPPRAPPERDQQWGSSEGDGQVGQ